MAPHWKCGLGQPVAGSNPALSATPARRRRADACVVACAPRSRTFGCARSGARRRLRLDGPRRVRSGWDAEAPRRCDRDRDRGGPDGGFRFAADEPWRGEVGVVIAYAIRHRAGIVLFDTGFGFGNAELDAHYHPVRRGGSPMPSARPGSRSTTSTPSRTATCTWTTPARTRRFPRPDLCPARRVGGRPHDRPHDPRLDRLPGRRLPPHRRATTTSPPASGSSPRRVTRPATSRWRSRPAPASSSSPARRSTRRGSGPATRRARGPVARAGSGRLRPLGRAAPGGRPGRGPVRPRRGIWRR